MSNKILTLPKIPAGDLTASRLEDYEEDLRLFCDRVKDEFFEYAKSLPYELGAETEPGELAESLYYAFRDHLISGVAARARALRDVEGPPPDPNKEHRLSGAQHGLSGSSIFTMLSVVNDVAARSYGGARD